MAFKENIFKLHGLPTVIVTDRDRIFTSTLWQDMFKSLGVKLHFSTSYHPQTDGQTESVNQCLEIISETCHSCNLRSGITGWQWQNGGTTLHFILP